MTNSWQPGCNTGLHGYTYTHIHTHVLFSRAKWRGGGVSLQSQTCPQHRAIHLEQAVRTFHCMLWETKSFISPLLLQYFMQVIAVYVLKHFLKFESRKRCQQCRSSSWCTPRKRITWQHSWQHRNHHVQVLPGESPGNQALWCSGVSELGFGLWFWHTPFSKIDGMYYDPVILFKDHRLHILATSVRGAYMTGFTNGQSKAIIHDLVCLIRLEGLCDAHSLRYNV